MEKITRKTKDFFTTLLRSPILIPVASLLILILFNLIADPGFFRLSVGRNSAGDLIMTGYPITVLDFGSELAILAIGMTLVTAATGGQDISIGATIAIAGSVILRVVTGPDSKAESMEAPLILAFLLAVVVSAACGAFNGVLVAYFRIQPMVATLILFTAGRSIAAWINQNRISTISDPRFAYWGCVIPGIPIPTPILISVICMIAVALLLRFTTLGLYVQSVGINEKSARLNGINPTAMKILSFVILGVGVAICGLIKTSRISTITYSTIAKDIEMDAILAVALGGNSLGGGKFNMKGSIIAAYVIQLLSTTLIKFQVPSVALPVYKAIVVIILVVLSAPVVREKISATFKHFKVKEGAAV